MIFQRRGVGIFAIIFQLRGYSPANPPPKKTIICPPLEKHFIRILRVYRGGYFWQIFGSEGVQPPPPPSKKQNMPPPPLERHFIYIAYILCVYIGRIFCNNSSVEGVQPRHPPSRKNV